MYCVTYIMLPRLLWLLCSQTQVPFHTQRTGHWTHQDQFFPGDTLRSYRLMLSLSFCHQLWPLPNHIHMIEHD